MDTHAHVTRIALSLDDLRSIVSLTDSAVHRLTQEVADLRSLAAGQADLPLPVGSPPADSAAPADLSAADLLSVLTDAARLVRDTDSPEERVRAARACRDRLSALLNG